MAIVGHTSALGQERRSELHRRPSGFPSLADIPLRCREPPQRANAQSRCAPARFAGEEPRGR
jgi:hypothetical protein